MSDIRRRISKKGKITYQIRYRSSTAKSGYAYATFETMKQAKAFVQSGAIQSAETAQGTSITTVPEAIKKWLEICEKEGLKGNNPVAEYTLKEYKYYANFLHGYSWQKPLQGLTPPDIVKVRSWLLANTPSVNIARISLKHLSTVFRLMVIHGNMNFNVANEISISSQSRYDKPIVIPSELEMIALCRAVDQLANSKNTTISKAWERYRPMFYLAGDTGMRPQEYLVVPDHAIEVNGIHITQALKSGEKQISAPKSKAGRRFVDTSPYVLDMVNTYLHRHPVENPHRLVFATDSGRWQSKSNWRTRGFGVACEKAGLMKTVESQGTTKVVPKFSPYDLRHYFASTLIEQRVNLKRLQKVMGHEDIQTTLKYYGHLIEKAEEQDMIFEGALSGLMPESCGEVVAQPR